MTTDEKYMHRCLQLAENGRGYTSPNPMVGAVIVHNGKIIGEGYHCKHGEAHAEVNAINGVKDKSLLKHSTIYVSLEPCSHHGKTPPCAQLIIEHNIKRVVIACLDPYPAVSGRGMQMMLDKGIDVSVGLLKKEALELNKAFITSHLKHRPYIYLKWAQTQDGYIDKLRIANQEALPTPISNNFTRMLVHKSRAEIDAIMVGTNTAVNDNPSLTTRFWHGKNPIRVLVDRQRRVPSNFHILDGKVKTIVFTETKIYENEIKHVIFEQAHFDESLPEYIVNRLHKRNINAIMIEGGAQLLQSFIDKGLWDEASIEVSALEFSGGVKAPHINGRIVEEGFWAGSKVLHLTNNEV